MKDPLDDLKSAWSELEAPAPAEHLADTDEVTQETVNWLRSAFDTLDVPAAELPARRLAPVVYIGLAAAACVLALAFAHRLTAISPHTPEEQVVVLDVPLLANPIFHEDGSIELKKGGVRLILLPDPLAHVTTESR